MFERVCQRLSQMAIDNSTILTDLQSGRREQYKFISFSKIVFHFSPFPGGVENTFSQFARNLTNSRIVYGLWSRFSRSIKMVAVWTEVATQLSLHFPGGKFIIWRNQTNTLNICDTMQPIFIKFSPKWSHCVWSSHSCNK